MTMYDIKDIRHIISGLENALQNTYEEYTEVIGRTIRSEAERLMLPMALTAHNTVAKDSMEWVFRAQANKDEPREYLKYMRVKDGIAECTNGHLILQAPTKWLDGFNFDGHHEIYQNINFPDTAGVIPDYDNWEPCKINRQSPARVEINNDIVVNAKYFLAVVDDEILDWEIAYDISNPVSCFKMRNLKNERKAIVMPLRVRFEEGLSAA